MKRRKVIQVLTGALLLSVYLLVSPARAQIVGAPSPEVSATTLAASLALPADDVLATFSKKEWSELRKQQFAALRSHDDRVWPHALRNITHLASTFGDRVNFACACPWLLDTYTTSHWQKDRLGALAAMHAIGDASTIETLARMVENEADPLIKHVTIAAVNDYYEQRQRRPSVKVGPPTIVVNQ
jgi:hypothetical protein